MTQNTLELGDTGQQKKTGPVTCLGITFENDEARRAHFIEGLRQKLQDPEFRKIEGFPIGNDEDILNLSDPPYYTACPNPWIADFIAEWEAQKPEQHEGDHYHREPFATDVSEGKNDPIYNAHSYHTKVPHKAIMRYILHYTQPGDIVFDGFCGTGMTGVAAQMCGDREAVISLGYQVKPEGIILQEETDENGKKTWKPFSKLGERRAILNDLSTAATFISYNYNNPVDPSLFNAETNQILKEVEEKYGWMYETRHTDDRKGKINYIVWSDVFRCPECTNEVVFWDVAVDRKIGKVRDEFTCPKCMALLTKRNVERAWETKFDPGTKSTVRHIKQAPVLINYSVGTSRFEKVLDADDFKNIEKVNSTSIPEWYPVEALPKGDKTGEPVRIGITHSHHFYSASSLAWLSAFREKCQRLDYRYLVPFSMINTISKLYRYNVKKPDYKGQGGGILTGTLYVPSLIRGLSAPSSYKRGQSRLGRIFEANTRFKKDFVLSTSSSSCFSAADECLDYVFIDPPFGSNLNYSELSFLWESWLGVKTNVGHEAIENKSQGKGGAEYREIMTKCFSEAYRLLKPGRWMTVEFSNTKASVWNSIQTALTEAGFIVANVSALDKKQGSFNAVTNTTSVKQDLVISAYKPNGGFEERFKKEAQTKEGVWDFVRTHLKYLPITKQQEALLQFVPERDPRILFDQMVAYYVRKGYPVPSSSQEFQIGLAQRFSERDGMFFLPDQVAEYDRKKMSFGGGLTENVELFVKDEESMIRWLRRHLSNKPQAFSDINPQFMQQLGGWSKNEAQLDLRELLNQNFLSYDGKGTVPEQIHAYLSSNWKELRNLPKDDPSLIAKASDRWYVPDPNKAGDLEKLREKALLKEFEEYKEAKKKLKVFRLEAIRAGFKKAWQERDYAVIVAVADKIPNKVLEEDPKLLMWYDQAVTRMGGE